jgi:hypothetical protein
MPFFASCEDVNDTAKRGGILDKGKQVDDEADTGIVG